MAKGRAPSSARMDRAHRQAEKGSGSAESDTMRIVWRDRTYSLSMDNVGPGDDLICRAQTSKWFASEGIDDEGYTVTGLLTNLGKGGRVGTDVVAVLVWMCRRKNGEPSLSFVDALAEVGSSVQLMTDVAEKKPAGAVDVAEVDAPGEDEAGPQSPPTPGPDSPNGSDSTPETS